MLLKKIRADEFREMQMNFYEYRSMQMKSDTFKLIQMSAH